MIGGIISPVHDSYGKPVSEQLFVVVSLLNPDWQLVLKLGSWAVGEDTSVQFSDRRLPVLMSVHVVH